MLNIFKRYRTPVGIKLELKLSRLENQPN